MNLELKWAGKANYRTAFGTLAKLDVIPTGARKPHWAAHLDFWAKSI